MNLANLTEAILGIKNEEKTSVIGNVNFILTTNSRKNHNDILGNINLTSTKISKGLIEKLNFTVAEHEMKSMLLSLAI